MTKEQTIKRDWLSRAFYAEKKLNALLYMYERDKERAQRITAVFGGNDKGRTDSRENGTEKLLAVLADSERKYSNYAAECAEIRSEIEEAISTIKEPDVQAVLKLHYLGFKPSFEKIAEEMHYSVETVKRRHKRGLDEIKIDTF